MCPISRTEMMEATRLTREGRLEEAMALLQGTRRPGPSAGSAGSRTEADESPARRTQPLIDMVPPSPASGGAWTAPVGAAASPGDAGQPRQRDLPMGLRGFMDRMVRLGATDALESGIDKAFKSRPSGPPGPAARQYPRELPAGARFEEHLYTNEAGSRPYKLYVPSTFAGQALPLVVMLHGCTQSPDDFAAGTRMNELAEEFGFLVAYPEQTQAANLSKCWNWFNAANQQRDRGEPSLIAGITRAIMRDFPVDGGRVYIAGLSAGGAKAAIMGATYPDLYAAVGVHSGLACGAARDMASAFAAMKQGAGAVGLRADPNARSERSVPTIVFHGDRDAMVHPVNGDEVAARAKAGAAHRTEVDGGQSQGGMAFTRTVHRDDSGRAMLEQWVLHGAGHAWSGGSAAGTYTDPLGPDASREMVRFFLQHETAVTVRD